MRIVRALVIGFTRFLTFAAFAYVGAIIGISMDHDIAALATGIEGLMIGALIGVIAAIAVVKVLAEYVWVDKKKAGETTEAMSNNL